MSRVAKSHRLVKALVHTNGVTLTMYSDPLSRHSGDELGGPRTVDLTRDGAQAVINVLTEALRVTY